MQMQTLVDSLPWKDANESSHRMTMFYSVKHPPFWIVENELIKILKSVGSTKQLLTYRWNCNFGKRSSIVTTCSIFVTKPLRLSKSKLTRTAKRLDYFACLETRRTILSITKKPSFYRKVEVPERLDHWERITSNAKITKRPSNTMPNPYRWILSSPTFYWGLDILRCKSRLGTLLLNLIEIIAYMNLM